MATYIGECSAKWPESAQWVVTWMGGYMPALAMFSKFKSASTAQCPLDSNPIGQFFEIGKQTASAGPELVWKIHDAYRKSDGKVSGLFTGYSLHLPLSRYFKHRYAPSSRSLTF